MNPEIIKTKATQMVTEIDPIELAIRIAEGFLGARRPVGCTSKKAFAGLDKESQRGFMQAAQNAATYICQCINEGKQPS